MSQRNLSMWHLCFSHHCFWDMTHGDSFLPMHSLHGVISQKTETSVTLPSVKIKVKKVNQSRNRPGVAQRAPGGLSSQIPWHSARKGGEVSLMHGPPLPPGMFLVLVFTRGWVNPRAMVRSEGKMLLKNPVTPPGINPGTVRLVAQHLNHYGTPGPICKNYQYINHRRRSVIILIH
jgi:hypothetical protein